MSPRSPENLVNVACWTRKHVLSLWQNNIISKNLENGVMILWWIMPRRQSAIHSVNTQPQSHTFTDYVQLSRSRVPYQGQGQDSVIDHSQSPAHKSGTVCLLRCER